MHDFLHLIISLLQRGVGFAVAAVALCCAVFLVVYVLFRILTRGARPFPWRSSVSALLLVGYLAVLLYATLFRYTSGGWSEANFHLFRAWREAWNSFSLQLWLNVLLNIALFVPLGVLLPLLGRPFRRWYIALPAGFMVSLAIEAIQYLAGRGMFDVDDLVCNTLGCGLGYCIVMILWRVLVRRERGAKGWLPYLAYPVAFALSMAVIFGGYHLKEYGNLPEAPAFRENLAGIRWELACTLGEGVSSAPVYRTARLDKESCDQFGQEFAQIAGLSFPDAYYYDNATLFANHSTGDFLMVNYLDGSYDYSLGTDTWGLPDAQVDEETLRAMLRPYGIELPAGTPLRYEGSGVHVFAVDMQVTEGGILDGELRCRCKQGPLLDEIENSLVIFTPYREAAVITPAQAYEQMQGGAFSGADFFANYMPRQVTVTSCTLDYRVDTKGFYQPVYVFETTVEEEPFWDVVIPAMK